MIQSLEHHALINKEVIARLIEAAQITDEDLVLEIGSGDGNITKELCSKAKYVVAVEKDSKCVEALKLLKQENLQIIEGDFLDVKNYFSEQIVLEHARKLLVQINKIECSPSVKSSFRQVKIPPWNKLVANPPFNILEPLMYYLSRRIFDCAVLIVGENFANELTNDEKTRVSILSKSYFQVEFIEQLSKSDFQPSPKTATAIIKITPKNKDFLNQKELFFREFFDQRDKTIKNSFIESCTRVLKLTQRQAKEKFNELKISGDKKVLLVKNEELEKMLTSIKTDY